jgi:hypothetical protein
VLLAASAVGGGEQGPAVGGDLEDSLQGDQNGVGCPRTEALASFTD